MIQRPQISVCIPTHNQGRYLREALESVLRQTKQDFEIVVYDDASTDDTPEIVASLKDEHLRYFRQRINVGIAANRNSCLAVARGHYIAWLDSDDVYQPEMLATQSDVLGRNSNVGLVHGAVELIDDEGRRLPDWPRPFSTDLIESGKDALRELILQNYINAPTVMVRRECHDLVGPYSRELEKSGEDWEMWLRIALHADLAYTANAVAQYRQHGASSSSVAIESGERLVSDIKVIERIFENHGSLIPDRGALMRRAGAALAAKALIRSGEAFVRGQYWAAFSTALQSSKIAPPVLRSRDGCLLLLSLVTKNEYANYEHSKAILNQLYRDLAGTRYGEQIRKIASVDAEWTERLRAIAQVVRRLVPERARVASVDKCDPTLLHLSERKGCHFPDWRLLPAGYPRDSQIAIDHLEQVRTRGAEYLVFPNAAFWWLEFYKDFRRHLDENYSCLWQDENCILYELRRRQSVKAEATCAQPLQQTTAVAK